MLLNTDLTRNLIVQRAVNALSSIKNDLSNGTLGTQEALLASIEASWGQIISGGLKSTIEIPDFRTGELPMKNLLEDPLFSSENDINILWDQLESIRSSLRDLFNLAQSESIAITTLIGEIQNKVVQFQLFSTDTSSLFLWASDSFTSRNYIDSQNTTVYIDTVTGICMLSADNTTSLNSTIEKFSIDTSNSYGIPGNNMEISAENGTSSPDSSTPESTVVLVGATDMRSQVAYMLDGNPSTWLEWEMNYIPQQQKCKLIGTQYHMDDSGSMTDIVKVTQDTSGQPAGWRKFIQWPGSATYDRNKDGKGYYIANFTQNNNAKMVITLNLSAPTKVSLITLTPQILSGVYTIVRNISVSNSQNSSYSKVIAKDIYLTSKLNESLNTSRSGIPQKNYAGIGVFSMDDETVDTINITLEADGSYIPQLGLGHQYYFQIVHKQVQLHIAFFSIGLSNTTVTERLPNPDVGISTGASSSNLSQIGELAGLVFGGIVGGTIGQVAGSLLSVDKSTTVIRQGNAYDVLYGARSAIGIKDLDISIKQYAMSSIIISAPWVFAVPIQAVSIISTETIPSSWGTSTEWISYEVSSDGVSWQHIVPQNRSNGVNDVAMLSGTQVIVRITLTRPADQINSSPILNNYALKVLPK
jgi:hypothetical protein